jgi:hypothetical protein
MSIRTVNGKFVTWTRGGVVALLAGLLVLALGQIGRVSLGEDLWFFGNVLSVMTLWVGGLWIAMVLFANYQRQRTSLIVSDNGVEKNSGIFRRQVERIEASKIESVKTFQSTLGGSRYGAIAVTGSGRAEIEVDSLENFLQVAEAIRNVSSAASPKGEVDEDSRPTAIPSSQSEVTKGLSELVELKERGLLTDEEFGAAKARFLEERS